MHVFQQLIPRRRSSSHSQDRASQPTPLASITREDKSHASAKTSAKGRSAGDSTKRQDRPFNPYAEAVGLTDEEAAYVGAGAVYDI